MNQAAVFPSLTDSTVVSEVPAKSPPQKTLGTLLCIVSGLTSGSPHLLNFSGDMASFTIITILHEIMEEKEKVCFLLLYLSCVLLRIYVIRFLFLVPATAILFFPLQLVV